MIAAMIVIALKPEKLCPNVCHGEVSPTLQWSHLNQLSRNDKGSVNVIVSYQDVFQLEISMDNSLLMNVSKGISDLLYP